VRAVLGAGDLVGVVSRKHLVWGVFSVLTTLQALDVASTNVFLSMGVEEGNPLARWLFLTIGFWPGAVAIKLSPWRGSTYYGRAAAGWLRCW